MLKYRQALGRKPQAKKKERKKMNIHNLRSPRSGRPVANQYVIMMDTKSYFQSYASVVCCVDSQNQRITFGRDWNYSRTTLKYLFSYLKDFAPLVDFIWNSKAIYKVAENIGFTDCYNRAWEVVFADL